VRFLFGFPCSFEFCANRNFIAGRTVFILTNGYNSNPFLPHVLKTPKTVMQTAIACGIICGK
jgi:hypothetical protein